MTSRWPGLVRPIVITPNAGAELPGMEVLLDPEGDAEERYGAAAECLYLVRPDLYIGFRSQPADKGRLVAFLERMLV